MKYKMLKPGDIVLNGDEYLSPKLGWRPIVNSNLFGGVYKEGKKPYRRPIKKLRIG